MSEQKFNEVIMNQYRSMLFPFISNNIISGYNLYKKRFKQNRSYKITYFHSDMKNIRDKHIKELLSRLKENYDYKINETIKNSIITRIAVYKIGDWEENPKNIRFFNSNGDELSIKDLDRYNDIIIAEGKQYEMNLEVNNKKDLRNLIKILSEGVNFYILNKNGKIVLSDEGLPKINTNAVYGSWEVPLLTIKNDNNINGFLDCLEFSLIRKEYEAVILVRKQKKKLGESLDKLLLEYKESKLVVNKLFVESYLDKD